MVDPDSEVRQLLEHRPRSHGSGSFLKLLPRGEAVPFETRPALGIYFLGGIAIVLVSTLLGLLCLRRPESGRIRVRGWRHGAYSRPSVS